MNAAKGDTENAEAQLSYTKITSPIDGVVTDRPIYPGETRATGSPIITVMDFSQIVARAHVAQLEAASLKVGDPATITVPGTGRNGERQSHTGESRRGREQHDGGSVGASANPGERLRPGTSVRVAMVAETVAQAVVIPQAALLTSPDGVTPSSSWTTTTRRQEKGQGRHPGRRVQNGANDGRAAGRRARGYGRSVRTRPTRTNRFWRKPRFKCKRRKCRMRMKTSNVPLQSNRKQTQVC